jgi:hypothetical protein
MQQMAGQNGADRFRLVEIIFKRMISGDILYIAMQKIACQVSRILLICSHVTSSRRPTSVTAA